MRIHFVVLIGLSSVLFVANGVTAAGTFASAPITGDADSGISTAKTYTHSVDFGGSLNGDPGTTINGVPFHVGGRTGPNYALSSLEAYPFTLPTNATPGGPNTLYDLFEDFYHNSINLDPPNQTLTLMGLTPGTAYTTTFYNVGFDLANAERVITVSTSDGASVTFDQNATGEGNPSVLRYTFTAEGTSITYTFDPTGDDTFHHYGFTNEIVPEPATGVTLLAIAALAAMRRR